MIENHKSGNLYNELFSQSSELSTVKTAQLFFKYFPPGHSLSLCILYFLFHRDKDTFAIPQRSVHHLVYAFPFFFRFHECLNNFRSSQNLLTNKFFTETCGSSCFYFHDAREFSVSL